MASAPPSLGRPEIITIDVTGAPRLTRTFVQTFEQIAGCVFMICFGIIAIGACGLIAELLAPSSLHNHYIMRLLTVGALILVPIASIIAVFWYPHRKVMDCARRIKIIPYDLTYIDVRRSVRKWLHRSFHRHPSVWAAINICAAITIFLYFAINEKNIVEVRPDRCHETWFYMIREYIAYLVAMDFLRGCNPYGREIHIGGLVLSIILLLNGVRIYGRSGGLPRYLVVLLLRMFVFMSFGALWIAAIVAFGIVAILLGSLVMYLWSLFMEGQAALKLFDPRTDSGWFYLSGILVASGLLTLLKETASPVWQPRLAAVERWLRRLSQAANLPSTSFEERRDRRSPVLYLRSFHEDWRHIQDSSGGYDRLEEVIGAPLRELGPLVAVGKPGELAFPGAARAKYSDNEWQEAVASTMDRASFVVVVVGWTDGLQWEIETVKGRGHLGKAIWLLPPEVEHHSLMCDWLRANYRGTRFEQVIKATDLSRAILVHSEVDGKLVVISGTARDSGEYEAAIQVAVYGMVRHLIREATHRKRRQPIV